MKASSKMGLVLGMVVAMSMASAAFADAGGGNDSHGSDNGNGNGGVNNGGGNGGTPAAPEPGIILMATAGIALGGGYLLWRRNRVAQKA